MRGLHGGVHVLGIGLGTQAERLAGGGVEGRKKTALGLVPSTAVIQVAVGGQHGAQGLGGCGHDYFNFKLLSN